MTRNLIACTIVFIGAFFVGGTSANAAPEVPEGCYLIGLPPSQYVLCPQGPADPDAPPPFYSICTPIEPIGELPRKSCQVYDRATDLPVGEPQIYVYPPEDGALPQPTTSAPAPTTTSEASSVSVAPRVTTPPARTVIVSSPSPVPGSPETVVETVEAAAPTTPPTTTPATSSGASRTKPSPPSIPPLTSDADRGGWIQSVSDGTLYGIAAAAALVLIVTMAIPTKARRKGAHREA